MSRRMVLRNRLLAAFLIAGGTCCVTAAAVTPALAVDCMPGEWIQPAECIAAHATPAPNELVTGLLSGCRISGGMCTAHGSGCSSTPTYNGAAKGRCQAYIGGCVYTRCQEDFLKTAVTLTKVIGSCATEEGKCGCKYSSAMPVETKDVEVCNCRQEII